MKLLTAASRMSMVGLRFSPLSRVSQHWSPVSAGTTSLRRHWNRTRSEHLPSDDAGAPMNPAFLSWLGSRLNAGTYTPDLVMSSFRAVPDPAFPLIERHDLDTHPRVMMARRYRREVRVFSDRDERGLLTIGCSYAGHMEISFEVRSEHRNQGLARRLAFVARSLAPENEPLFAGVSPGNAASVRALLAAGFRPICSEVVIIEGGIREARGWV